MARERKDFPAWSARGYAAPMAGSPPLNELRAVAQHAAQRLALYRRRVYLGRGTQHGLAELERTAKIAADRLRRAESDAARQH